MHPPQTNDRRSSFAGDAGYALLRISCTAAVLASMALGPALAADLAVKAPPREVAAGGFYIWLDGSWDRVALPAYTLGPRKMSALLLPMAARY